MLLTLSGMTLYADGLFLCFAEAGNGRSDLPTGSYTVSPTYSHTHGRNLALATGLGWCGADRECDLVLGRVRAGNGVIPCDAPERRLFALVEAADEIGHTSTLVIE